MINCKLCRTCEHYRPGDEYCYTTRAYHDCEEVCSAWAPKHGEWISTALAKPQDDEMVAVIYPSGIDYAFYKKSVHSFARKDGHWMQSHETTIPWWMRFPGRPV